MTLGGCGEVVRPQDLRKLDKVPLGNAFLACRSDLCKAPASIVPPAFELSPARLVAAVRRAVGRQPRVELIFETFNFRQLVCVQRSAVFRFPDVVRIQFFDLGGGRSTIALFSRSVYGRSDFGVNEERVRAWLEAMVEEAARPAP